LESHGNSLKHVLTSMVGIGVQGGSLADLHSPSKGCQI